MSEVANVVESRENVVEKKRPKSLPLSLRVEILKRLESGEKIRQLSSEYQVARGTIQRIVKKRDNILKYMKSLASADTQTSTLHYHGVEKTILERIVTSWFLQKRSLGEPVYGWVIQEKALEFNKLLRGPTGFKASNGWLYKFKCRHGIQSLSLQGEREPHTGLASQEFRVVFTTFMLKNGYNEEDVYNADEIGICYKSLPSVLNHKQRTDIMGLDGWFKRDDHATVLFCSNMSGTHKLPLFIVGKEFINFDNLKKEALPVTYVGNNDGIMDKIMFSHWYQYMFLPHMKYRSNRDNELRRVVLLLDNALLHLDVQSLQSDETSCRVIHLPTNVAAPVQPMCQGIMERTIKHYRTRMLKDLCATFDSDSESFLNDLNITKFCHKIAEAWDKIPKSELRAAWNKVYKMKKCAKELNNSYQELVDLVDEISQSEETVTEESIKAWVTESTPGWKIMTDEELTFYITGLSATVKQEPESMETEDCDQNMNTDMQDSKLGILEQAQCDVSVVNNMSAHNALLALKTVTDFCEHRWEFDEHDMTNLTRIRDTLMRIVSNER